MKDVFVHTITDLNAPERLRGKQMIATLTAKGLTFTLDSGDIELTPQELGYFRYTIGELAAKLRDQGIPLPEGKLSVTRKEE